MNSSLMNRDKEESKPLIRRRHMGDTRHSQDDAGVPQASTCRFSKIIGFEYPHREAFYQCQWPVHPGVHLVYRIVTAIYFLVCLILSTIMFQNSDLPNPWIVFLTNWQYSLLTFYLLWAAGICLYYTFNEGTVHGNQTTSQGSSEDTNENQFPDVTYVFPTSNLPWYIVVDWLMFAILSSFTILVSIGYFAILMPLLNIDRIIFIDFQLHGANSIMVMVEVLWCAIPIRFLHFIYSLLFGILYVIFSVIYWMYDHENNVLYPGVLDWNDPQGTVITLLILGAAIPAINAFIYLLYKLRLFLYNKYCNRES